ncbi:molybdopterin-binding protein [Actibacterium sp. 188UL27-1]|uniref:molybdopterin-binding protein n=1 Tax=Actibacterium sp. 188UL27-1 TaxID=2786961 RepID=UPI00195C359D|nr:molybdopterin-binding protein [Actibacterium sp. 188UL27-1]MBM7066759.1 molybdopterin-binding protein [Actibacterium sp. 188UL27-1]
MEFGPVPVTEAIGAMLAHSQKAGGTHFRKGQVVDPAMAKALLQAGLTHVTVARLSPDDVDENTAAAQLAAAIVPDATAACLKIGQAFTGRVNLNAIGPGIVAQDQAAIHRLNRVHPSITLATLPQYTRVAAGTLVGTVKIISYGVEKTAVSKACEAARTALRVLPVKRATAHLILTSVPGQKPSLNDKGRKAVEGRLKALGIDLAHCETVPHQITAVAAALGQQDSDIGLILTGSATSDMNDTAPAAIRAAGGEVMRFGMPVDPGNLLVLGNLRGQPVIGLPGCARSPALNGADWVLERIACGVEITDDDIASMGVGGLLKEIPLRPQPREPK